jgi:diaminopimelate epimerase
VQVLDHDRIRVVVWERGAGRTLACGTGACAAAVATHLLGKTGRHVKVLLPGGELDIEYAANGRVQMIGPAILVFTAGLPDAQVLQPKL